ncbi:unnamed protein product [Bursaphelenchus okinawaensis]|uniref:Uncharacterized protein n=1 Tax=Bursaphelenchus okinawaensis TaxID=465554 RepID=A0A811JRD8_9BILA|nr:unnamed protein product [Bursaphelenchus okinawaensis]CAG9079327.1 unnamed protein product [Bursaphelenchus okinawaensis]
MVIIKWLLGLGLLGVGVHGFSAHEELMAFNLTKAGVDYEVTSDPFRIAVTHITRSKECAKEYACVCYNSKDGGKLKEQALATNLPDCVKTKGFMCGSIGTFNYYVSLRGQLFSVDTAEHADIPPFKVEMRLNDEFNYVPVISLQTPPALKNPKSCQFSITAQHLKPFKQAKAAMEDKVINCPDCKKCQLSGPDFGNPNE